MQFTSIKFILPTSQKKSTSGITKKLPEKKYSVGHFVLHAWCLNFACCTEIVTWNRSQWGKKSLFKILHSQNNNSELNTTWRYFWTTSSHGTSAYCKTDLQLFHSLICIFYYWHLDDAGLYPFLPGFFCLSVEHTGTFLWD